MGSVMGALLGTLSVLASNVLLATAFVGLGLGVRRDAGQLDGGKESEREA